MRIKILSPNSLQFVRPYLSGENLHVNQFGVWGLIQTVSLDSLELWRQNETEAR